MFKFHKRRPIEPADPAPAPQAFAEATHPAVDLSVAFLRSLGASALGSAGASRGELLEQCEAWARHLLLGEPHPDSGTPGGELGRRDWAGAREFVARVLRAESGFAQQAMQDLREALWTALRGLNEAAQEDEGSDAQLDVSLELLTRAIDSGAPPEQVRDEVLAAVGRIRANVVERRERHKAHLDELGSRIHSLGAELDSARRDGETDALTRLYNRKAFDDEFARAVEVAQATGCQLDLLFIDVDHFKAANDRFGHAAGDAVLRRIADRLSASFMRRGDFVARFGGEEFVVLLRDTPSKDVRGLAQRALAAVREQRLDDIEPGLRMSVSVGHARLRGDDTPGTWIDRADRGMYAAKRAGRDRCVFDDSPLLTDPLEGPAGL